MTRAQLFRCFALASLPLAFAACETTNSSNSGYVSNYGTDGGYNPYPGQQGYAQPGGGTYVPPPPPNPTPPPDPYAFSAPSTPPPSSTSSSSSSSRSSSSSSSPSYTRYTVKKGDTLYSLARKNGTTVSKIKSANGLSSDLIRIGQTLKIP